MVTKSGNRNAGRKLRARHQERNALPRLRQRQHRADGSRESWRGRVAEHGWRHGRRPGATCRWGWWGVAASHPWWRRFKRRCKTSPSVPLRPARGVARPRREAGGATTRPQIARNPRKMRFTLGSSHSRGCPVGGRPGTLAIGTALPGGAGSLPVLPELTRVRVRPAAQRAAPAVPQGAAAVRVADVDVTRPGAERGPGPGVVGVERVHAAVVALSRPASAGAGSHAPPDRRCQLDRRQSISRSRAIASAVACHGSRVDVTRWRVIRLRE